MHVAHAVPTRGTCSAVIAMYVYDAVACIYEPMSICSILQCASRNLLDVTTYSDETLIFINYVFIHLEICVMMSIV